MKLYLTVLLYLNSLLSTEIVTLIVLIHLQLDQTCILKSFVLTSEILINRILSD